MIARARRIAVLLAASLPAARASGRGDGTFEAPPTIPGSAGAIAVGTADFDRDGRPDLAVAGQRGLRLLLQDPSAPGGWNPLPFISETIFWSVLAADFTGSGLDDLAASDPGTTAQVFRARGGGAFGGPAALEGSAGSRAIVAADFDGDGRLDVASADFAASRVSIHRGNGDGTFTALESYPMPGFPHDLKALDFDGDGRTDLAAKLSDKGIVLLRGEGDGTFTPLGLLADLGTGGPIAAADFDGDGKGDLVAFLGVGISRGDGMFQVTLAGNFFPPVPGDLDGDGTVDLVTGEPGTTVLQVHPGNGDGTFAPAVPMDPGVAAKPLLAQDLDGDGRADLVMTYGTSLFLTVIPGGAAPRFPAEVDLPQGTTGLQALAIGDLDRDGLPDLFIAQKGEPALELYRDPGSPAPAPPLEIDPVSTCLTLGAVDLDGDGVLDLAGTNYGQVVATLLDATGGVRASRVYPVDIAPSAAAWGRLTEGPGLDLAVTSPTRKSILVLPARGDGTFGDLARLPTIDRPAGLAAGDLDGDGHADLLVRSKTALAVQFGAGGGSFSDAVVLLGDPTPAVLADAQLADLDGDGTMDAVAAGSAGLFLLRGTGGRAFETVSLGLGNLAALAMADLDGDGYLDIVLGGADRSQAMVLSNRGGSLATPAAWQPREYELGFIPLGFRIADMDGDGALDLLAFDAWGIMVLSGKPAAGGPSFLRGDATGDGKVDLTDAIALLARLFQGGPGLGGRGLDGRGLACDAAADANADGRVDLTDALALLGTLFGGAGPLPPPGPAACGPDPAPHALDCAKGCP